MEFFLDAIKKVKKKQPFVTRDINSKWETREIREWFNAGEIIPWFHSSPFDYGVQPDFKVPFLNNNHLITNTY